VSGRTDHTFKTLVARIDGDAGAVGYSADTGPGWPPTELGAGFDLVLCEATDTMEYEGTARSSGLQAGGLRRKGPLSGDHAAVADDRAGRLPETAVDQRVWERIRL
jgi:hypothetical protein